MLLAMFLGFFSEAEISAKVRLPALFTDNLVLQQGKSVAVWGWADEGELVVVQYRGQVKTSRAKNGKWLVHLSPMVASATPFVLAVLGDNTIELKNVVVGEVWVASGQSNMQWPLSRTDNWTKAAASSTNPDLRLFYVPRIKSATPLDDLQGEHLGAKPRWMLSGPDSTPEFSAVAYYFARDLQKALNVPVGIIHTSWGGSPAEVWMSESVLMKNPVYRKEILEKYEVAVKNYQEAKSKWDAQQSQLKAKGQKATSQRAPRMPWRPSELYNGMIHPLIPFAFKGAIWYQGESNASRAWQYRSLFPDMISNWRRDWGQGQFPFLAVELAPWDFNRKRDLSEITRKPGDSTWAELREAQLLATKVLGDVATVTITDVGNKDNIHPTNKEPVGARLALAARGLAYRERIIWSGPEYRRSYRRGSETIIQFNHVGSGLEARGGALTGFSIAGKDGQFVWANARIDGSNVIVSHPNIKDPAAVRFGWADFPVVNLWNKEGLPAHPFRTDDFRVTTQPGE